MYRHSSLITAALLIVLAAANTAQSQVTVPRVLSTTRDRHATLEEQLINRLRATSRQQRAFLRFVVEKVRQQELEFRLVVAVERYALKRNPHLPFLFFERALRFQARRRGVDLPPVQQFATTRPQPPEAAPPGSAQ